jgi:hypothetical protein
VTSAMWTVSRSNQDKTAILTAEKGENFHEKNREKTLKNGENPYENRNLFLTGR